MFKLMKISFSESEVVEVCQLLSKRECTSDSVSIQDVINKIVEDNACFLTAYSKTDVAMFIALCDDTEKIKQMFIDQCHVQELRDMNIKYFLDLDADETDTYFVVELK